MKGIKWATVRAVASATVLLVACANPSAGQTPTEERALHRFGQAVSEYARLHHQLERSLPPLEVTDDMEALYRVLMHWPTVFVKRDRTRVKGISSIQRSVTSWGYDPDGAGRP